MQVTIANIELKLGEKFVVFHYVKCIEHIVAELLGNDKHVFHTFAQTTGRAHIVVTVGNAELLVHFVF